MACLADTAKTGKECLLGKDGRDAVAGKECAAHVDETAMHLCCNTAAQYAR